MKRKIRVLLADDHLIVRKGLRKLLEAEPDIEIVGEAADGREAIQLARRLLPDIVMMDLSMPIANGIEATRIIHCELFQVRVIGLSVFEEAEGGRAMREAGAVDYLSKGGASGEIIAAIRKATNHVV